MSKKFHLDTIYPHILLLCYVRTTLSTVWSFCLTIDNLKCQHLTRTSWLQEVLTKSFNMYACTTQSAWNTEDFQNKSCRSKVFITFSSFIQPWFIFIFMSLLLFDLFTILNSRYISQPTIPIVVTINRSKNIAAISIKRSSVKK